MIERLMNVDRARVLDEYSELTERLEQLYENQGQHKAAELTTYANTWESAVSYGITERNALAKNAAAMYTAETLKLEGQIQAALARLRYLDRLLEGARDV